MGNFFVACFLFFFTKVHVCLIFGHPAHTFLIKAAPVSFTHQPNSVRGWQQSSNNLFSVTQSFSHVGSLSQLQSVSMQVPLHPQDQRRCQNTHSNSAQQWRLRVGTHFNCEHFCGTGPWYCATRRPQRKAAGGLRGTEQHWENQGSRFQSGSRQTAMLGGTRPSPSLKSACQLDHLRQVLITVELQTQAEANISGPDGRGCGNHLSTSSSMPGCHCNSWTAEHQHHSHQKWAVH